MPTGVTRLTRPEQATQLARHLLDPGRRRPVVVVTSAAGHARPYVDADQVADALGDLADVYVLPTGDVTWALSAGLPDRTEVYGGAGRVYAVDPAWQTNPYRSRLHFAFGPADSAKVVDALVSDALAAAGPRTTSSRTAIAGREVSGTVIGLVAPSRALVNVDDGTMATVWHELAFPDVPIEQVFVRGMAVRGRLDPGQGRLDVAASQLPAEQALAGYRVGDVVLTRVAAVEATTARLVLYPGVEVAVGADQVTGNPLDRLTSLLTVGEVVAAHVAETPSAATDAGGGRAWRLTLLDVEDDEPTRSAPALLPGGPPWLVLAPPVPVMAEVAAPPPPVAAPAEPAPAPEPARAERRDALHAAQLSLDAARAEVTRLQDAFHLAERRAATATTDLAAMRTERDSLVAALQAETVGTARLERELERLRTELRRAVQSRQRAEKALRTNGSRGGGQGAAPGGVPAFADPEQRLRHEVYLAWVARIPAADKPHRPLGPFAVGPGFLASLDELEGVDRAKTVDVVMEIATGLVDEVRGRDLHRLRVSAGGGSPVVTRADGAVCWRAALQVNTPSARRIHFWRGPSGVELSRVVVHDDMEP